MLSSELLIPEVISIGQGPRALPMQIKRKAMKIDTPIFIASITKMYTSAATMILGERDLLSLDDPISKFLPYNLLEGLHRYKGVDYSDQLRIYHLISQTSGLPDYFQERPKGGKSIFDLIVAGGDEEWDVEKVVGITKNNLSPKFPPESNEQKRSGKKAYYSDTNYQLLGAVIESVAQKPLYEVFSELIIEPLELSSTYLHGQGEPRAIQDRSSSKHLLQDNASPPRQGNEIIWARRWHGFKRGG